MNARILIRLLLSTGCTLVLDLRLQCIPQALHLAIGSESMSKLGDPLLLGSQGFREYLVPILLRGQTGCVEGVVLLDEEGLELF